jgi:putative acetyltransferase
MNRLVIDQVDPVEYPKIVEIWESSVRATHDFLKEEDIQFFKPLILKDYLKAVKLTCVRNGEQKILGFAGVAEGKLEMLFIHPDAMGQGIGRALTLNAIRYDEATKVDVNEANPDAVAFYKHMGFEVVGRSELDSLGKPFPILSMEYRPNC